MTGKAVLRIRRQLGLTQRQFAKRVGVHWNTVARWERDEKRITEPISKLLRLWGECDALIQRIERMQRWAIADAKKHGRPVDPFWAPKKKKGGRKR